MWHGPCDPKKKSVVPVNRTAKESSRRQKTFVCISKSAVRGFVLFMKSVKGALSRILTDF